RERPLFAVGDRLDAASVDAVARQVLLRRGGAPIAEGQVVFIRPALVAVPADADPQGAVRLQNRHFLIEHGLVFGPQRGFVVVEVNQRHEGRFHFLAGARRGGRGISSPLRRQALRVFASPARRIRGGGRDRILPSPLRRGRDRIRVLRCDGGFRRLLPA